MLQIPGEVSFQREDRKVESRGTEFLREEVMVRLVWTQNCAELDGHGYGEDSEDVKFRLRGHFGQICKGRALMFDAIPWIWKLAHQYQR